MKKNKVKIIKLIIDNLITLIRLVGAFLLPIIYYKLGVNIAANYIIILFLTDFIDGTLARLFNVSTFFGSVLDASSDKILNAISFIILGFEYNIMFAPLVIEISILYTAYSTYRYGGNVQSTFLGKAKTLVLDILVICSFLLLSLPTLNINTIFINKLISSTDLIIHIFGFIILIACLIALFDYVGKNKLARANPKALDNKYKNKKKKPIKMIISNLFDTEYYKEHKNESIAKQLYIK